MKMPLGASSLAPFLKPAKMQRQPGSAAGGGNRADTLGMNANAFRTIFNVAIATGLTILVVIAWLAYGAVDAAITSGRQETHTQEVLTGVEEIFAQSERATAAAHRYAAYGDNRALDNFHTLATSRVPKELADVVALTHEDPLQQQRLEELDAALREQFALLEKIIMARVRPGQPPPDYDKLNPLEERIASLAGAVRAQETGLLSAYRERAARTARAAQLTTFWGGLLTMLLVGGAWWIARRYDHERELVEGRLRAAEEGVRRLTDSVPGMICYLDRERRIIYHNRTYREVLGLTREQIEGLPAHAVVGADVYAQSHAYVERALAGETVAFERVHSLANGEIRHLACSYTPDLDGEGNVIGLYGMHLDITERKRAEAMKGEFIAQVSHELRTPLTSILGALEIVNDGIAGELPVHAVRMVRIAHANTERLLKLVGEILDVQKMSAGQFEVKREPVDVALLVRQAVNASAGFAQKAGVTLAAAGLPESAAAIGDSDRIVQVVSNLVSNAVKFSPRGGAVQVAMQVQPRFVSVAVIDRGEGIPRAVQPRVFERFFQGSTIQGTGLGLAISKGIIDMMGGVIGFESQEGRGSTFHFTLPRSVLVEEAANA
ncbi:MAG TPA: ATP-binding protein [Burkholderiales bacterium]|nr:ATP-binding protein [Burkholderiales bacterium]